MFHSFLNLDREVSNISSFVKDIPQNLYRQYSRDSDLLKKGVEADWWMEAGDISLLDTFFIGYGGRGLCYLSVQHNTNPKRGAVDQKKWD